MSGSRKANDGERVRCLAPGPALESSATALDLRKFEADNQGVPDRVPLSFLVTRVPKAEKSKKKIVLALGVLAG
jgi:hypothetical protein